MTLPGVSCNTTGKNWSQASIESVFKRGYCCCVSFSITTTSINGISDEILITGLPRATVAFGFRGSIAPWVNNSTKQFNSLLYYISETNLLITQGDANATYHCSICYPCD